MYPHSHYFWLPCRMYEWGYVTKSQPQSSTEKQWREQTSNNTLPQLPLSHPRSHQPIKGPSPQAQRSQGHATADKNLNRRLLRKEHHVWATPELTQESLSPCAQVWKPPKESFGAAHSITFQTKWGCCSGVWGNMMRCSRRAFGDCTALITGSLGEELKTEGKGWI